MLWANVIYIIKFIRMVNPGIFLAKYTISGKILSISIVTVAIFMSYKHTLPRQGTYSDLWSPYEVHTNHTQSIKEQRIRNKNSQS